MRGRHRVGVPPAQIEWVQIQSATDAAHHFPVQGEIPRYIFEAVMGEPFVAGKTQWINAEQSATLRTHPSYRTAEALKSLTASIPESSGHV